MDDELEIGPFRSDRPGIRKVLGDLEADVMETIWSRPLDHGTTVREVFEILYKSRSIAYTTVMTTMTRLSKKNLLRTEKVDQAFVYYPTLSQEQFVLRFVGYILEDLLVNFAGPTLQSLEALPDQEAADKARALLVELARRRAAEED